MTPHGILGVHPLQSQLNLHGKPQEKYCQGQAGREDPWISIEQCSLVITGYNSPKTASSIY